MLLRIILSSTQIGDTVLDPFAGTGTTLVVSNQLKRNTLGIEIDPDNVRCINERVKIVKSSDSIKKYYKDYIHTENLKEIWDNEYPEPELINKKGKILNVSEVEI